MTVTAHVRAINASGFRIPSFSLQALVSGKMEPGELYISPGVEYSSPGSMIERMFVFPLCSFEPMRIVVRVVYPDLTWEAADRIPAHYLGSVNSKDRENATGTFTSCIDCIPLYLPVHALLIPYGAGSLCTIKSFCYMDTNFRYRRRRCFPGIPHRVFRSLYGRLLHTQSIPVYSTFCESSEGTKSHSGSLLSMLLRIICSRSRGRTLKGSMEIDTASLVEVMYFQQNVILGIVSLKC